MIVGAALGKLRASQVGHLSHLGDAGRGPALPQCIIADALCQGETI